MCIDMTFDELKKYKDKIINLAKNRKIDNVRVFGSVVKNTSTSKSDIDFLIHMKQGADLLDLSGFRLDLEDLIGSPVDVVPDNSLHHLLEKQILLEAVSLSE